MNADRVLFTDESRFSLSSDSHRILIWREPERPQWSSNIIARDRGMKVAVFSFGEASMLGSRTDSFTSSTQVQSTGPRYCNEILFPYVRLLEALWVCQDSLLLVDNAPCYRIVAPEQLLESEDIEHCMDWPAYLIPDLNPIEHVWDFLGRRLAARTLPPVTTRELRLALQDEWANNASATH
ncbi:transposable element Tcb1 transposase [Trichonephila clavipes]|nr:transposable element Tcb1 transposase [Trichonephila clavipes]